MGLSSEMRERMTEQIDFRCDFLVRARGAAPPGIYGTPELSAVSGFATSLEVARHAVARGPVNQIETLLSRYRGGIPS
jgi:hypothetical protein